MEYVGADQKSIDPTRVFRVAGSVNAKNGKKVVIEYRHDYRYILRELQAEYLPELSPDALIHLKRLDVHPTLFTYIIYEVFITLDYWI